jgi:hypothetical protein
MDSLPRSAIYRDVSRALSTRLGRIDRALATSGARTSPRRVDAAHRGPRTAADRVGAGLDQAWKDGTTRTARQG